MGAPRFALGAPTCYFSSMDYDKIYSWILWKAYRIYFFPLFLSYEIITRVIDFYYKYHFSRNIFPDRLILLCWKMEKYILNEIPKIYEETIDWFAPDLDEKTKKEYTMKALTPGKEIHYVCKSDLAETKKNSDNKKHETVFLLKPMTAAQMAEVRDNMYKIEGMGKKRQEKFITGTAELNAIRAGLKGWTNFKNDEGNDIKFDSDKIDTMIEFIPPEVRSELAGKIRGESELDEGEE